uniref:hypothetical protein n=1 Tax=Paractinoplanes polyasparticus TaxID=2856853 RepID=UPI001C843EC6|nr:hypothetical protein [Actinoplanes polyasparticus]
MSVQQITRESVKAAIRAGHSTRLELAGHFGVLPNSHTLKTVVDTLIGDGELHEDPDGTLWIRREPDLFHQEERND